MSTSAEVEAYRKDLLHMVCTKKHVIAIYGGDDQEMNEVAKEANMLTKLPIYDRHKILKFLLVKPLNLEDWK